MYTFLSDNADSIYDDRDNQIDSFYSKNLRLQLISSFLSILVTFGSHISLLSHHFSRVYDFLFNFNCWVHITCEWRRVTNRIEIEMSPNPPLCMYV